MSKFMNLVKSQTFKPLEIRNKADNKAEIVIYAPIGDSWFGDSVTAKQFHEELKKMPDSTKEIELRINSPGGDVFEGITIYNRLKQHKAKVKVFVDGMAASIASIIALAGDEIYMGEGSQMMIHLPWTIAFGNRNDFDNTVNRLVDIEEQMISIYRNKTGLSRDEIRGMLEKETWMDAQESLDKGFATHVTEEKALIAASAFDKADWIKRRPANAISTNAVVKKELKNLISKVEGQLQARK